MSLLAGKWAAEMSNELMNQKRDVVFVGII